MLSAFCLKQFKSLEEACVFDDPCVLEVWELCDVCELEDDWDPVEDCELDEDWKIEFEKKFTEHWVPEI